MNEGRSGDGWWVVTFVIGMAALITGIVGIVMAVYFVNVLRPVFVLAPPFHIDPGSILAVVGSILAATAVTSVAASSLVNRLRATELLRDEE